ncbi:MAG: DUF4760 domain-containing protein, partial [Candidatus Eremiobacteraeota bacterium]|nr:DUF4760 domain-containing protein [Candidatus Eremiobacteraeota bacterium]
RHLRAGNQLTTLLTLMRMWDQPEMQEHVGYMRGPFQEKLKEPAYMRGFTTRALPRSEHPELLVADYWEQIGAFVKYGLFDERSWLDVACNQIEAAWEALEPAIMAMRVAGGSAVFENFEYIAVRAQLWIRAHPDGYYPKRTPRMAQLKAGLRST